MNSENDILDVEEVMEILYIGRNYAYKLLNSGELKAFRVGRKWRIPRKSLEEFIINRCSGSHLE
ncbi:excisionase [Bacillus sp. VT 712]|nr:excisionase [Bacillus sp. VT 712]